MAFLKFNQPTAVKDQGIDILFQTLFWSSKSKLNIIFTTIVPTFCLFMWIHSSALSLGKSSAMCHFSTSFTTASCLSPSGPVSGSCPVATPPSSGYSTPLFTFSCTHTTCCRRWDPSTRSTSGGSSTWPRCRWSSLSESWFTLFSW